MRTLLGPLLGLVIGGGLILLICAFYADWRDSNLILWFAAFAGLVGALLGIATVRKTTADDADDESAPAPSGRVQEKAASSVADVIDPLLKKIEQYRRAIEYLDTCGEFTFEKYVEVNRLADSGLPRAKLQELWAWALQVLPPMSDDDKRPLDAWGAEYARWQFRQSALKAISEFEKLTGALATAQPAEDSAGVASSGSPRQKSASAVGTDRSKAAQHRAAATKLLAEEDPKDYLANVAAAAELYLKAFQANPVDGTDLVQCGVCFWIAAKQHFTFCANVISGNPAWNECYLTMVINGEQYPGGLFGKQLRAAVSPSEVQSLRKYLEIAAACFRRGGELGAEGLALEWRVAMLRGLGFFDECRKLLADARRRGTIPAASLASAQKFVDGIAHTESLLNAFAKRTEGWVVPMPRHFERPFGTATMLQSMAKRLQSELQGYLGAAVPEPERQSQGSLFVGMVRRFFALALILAAGWLAWGQAAPPGAAWLQLPIDTIQQAFENAELAAREARAYVGAGAGAIVAFLLAGSLRRPWRALAFLFFLGGGALAGWLLSTGSPTEWLAEELQIAGSTAIMLVCVATAALLLGLCELLSPAPSPSAAPAKGMWAVWLCLVPGLMFLAGRLAWGEETPVPNEWAQPVIDAIQDAFLQASLEPRWARALVGAGIGGGIVWLLGGEIWRSGSILGMFLVLALGAGAGWLLTTEYCADWFTGHTAIEGLTPCLVLGLSAAGVLLGFWEWILHFPSPNSTPHGNA